MSDTDAAGDWPAIPLAAWQDTRATLHMWMQVVGKLCLAMTPLSNHFWNVAFRVTSRGLITPTLDAGTHAMTMTFDFVAHQLIVQCSDGRTQSIALAPRSVADFHATLMHTLREMGVDVHIWTMPVEIPDPIRFEDDNVHKAYDPVRANAFWRALVAITPVLERFRGNFVGKCSPVQFFWGSFDLAVTRFSGRPAPPRAGADSITREAYSHEAISHGFWPGSGAVTDAAFYAYAAPEPKGFANAPVAPGAAYYSNDFSEFILPYDAVRATSAPAAALTEFLATTYDAAASLAKWDRGALERSAGDRAAGG